MDMFFDVTPTDHETDLRCLTLWALYRCIAEEAYRTVISVHEWVHGPGSAFVTHPAPPDGVVSDDTLAETHDGVDNDDTLTEVHDGVDNDDSTAELYDGVDNDDSGAKLHDGVDKGDNAARSPDGTSPPAPERTLAPSLIPDLYRVRIAFQASRLYHLMRPAAERRYRTDLLMRLSPSTVGRQLTRLGVHRERTMRARTFHFTFTELARHVAAHPQALREWGQPLEPLARFLLSLAASPGG